METTIKTCKGGRPRLLDAPTNSGECRALIAREVARTNPREETLRRLYRLLKAYVSAEDAARSDAKLRALEEQNQLAKEELAHRKADYLLRFVARPLGQKALLHENARLKAKVAALELAVKTNVTSIDCGTMQEKSSETRNDAA